MALRASQALLPDGTLAPAVITFDGPRIASVEPIHGTAGSTDAAILAPGFIDLQVNGRADLDVWTATGSDWDRLDALLVAQGVTTWCPTLVSAPLDAYPDALAHIAGAAARPPLSSRPTIAGAHLEGPFLGGARGAHASEHVREVDLDWLRGLPRSPIVQIVTLAPEIPGALEALGVLEQRGIVAALGHSTATATQASAAIDAGARLVTHVFNAMGPLHHREPGLVGVALTDDRVAVSLIADGVHVDPRVIRLVFRAKPRDRVALVTDAVAWERAVALGQLRLVGGVPRRANGTLAGTTLTMDAAVRTAVAAGVPLAQALEAAARAPAAILGLGDRGILAPGARADLVALTDDLTLAGVWIAGECAWP